MIPTQDIILEALVGSSVYGTALEEGQQDQDLMAVLIEPKESVLGFNTQDTWTYRTKPEGVRSQPGDVDWIGYGLRKFVSLALKGNPSVLTLLFVSDAFIRMRKIAGSELRLLAESIVSQQCVQPFRGYIHQQEERLFGRRGSKDCNRPELIEKYGFDTKYAGHIVRLALQGAELLTTGKLSFPLRENDRELVVAIRRGEFSLDEVGKIIKDCKHQFEEAVAKTVLAKQPETRKVEDWMIQTYLDYWK